MLENAGNYETMQRRGLDTYNATQCQEFDAVQSSMDEGSMDANEEIMQSVDELMVEKQRSDGHETRGGRQEKK